MGEVADDGEQEDGEDEFGVQLKRQRRRPITAPSADDKDGHRDETEDNGQPQKAPGRPERVELDRDQDHADRG